MTKKQKRILILLAVIPLLVTLFIFSNSLKDSASSNAVSDRVIEWLRPILDRIFPDVALQNFLVRKLAHVLEFAMLGIAIALFHRYVQNYCGKHFYGFACFYGLAVAVIDELIQSISDRTDSVQDVCLDFSGYMIGVLLMIGIFLLTDHRNKLKKL